MRIASQPQLSLPSHYLSPFISFSSTTPALDTALLNNKNRSILNKMKLGEAE
jgi:hypothetical protein